MRLLYMFFTGALFLNISFGQMPKEAAAMKQEDIKKAAQANGIIPSLNQTIKYLGTNITVVTLNASTEFIPRGVETNILSFTIKDSGNYLVIWKIKGMDTTSFYPNAPEVLAMDSSGSAYLSINGGNKNAQDFLLKQYTQAANNVDDKISFLAIPLNISEVMHLNKNDTLSLKVLLKGFPISSSEEKRMNLPAKFLATCLINAAEILLIRIND